MFVNLIVSKIIIILQFFAMECWIDNDNEPIAIEGISQGGSSQNNMRSKQNWIVLCPKLFPFSCLYTMYVYYKSKQNPTISTAIRQDYQYFLTTLHSLCQSKSQNIDLSQITQIVIKTQGQQNQLQKPDYPDKFMINHLNDYISKKSQYLKARKIYNQKQKNEKSTDKQNHLKRTFKETCQVDWIVLRAKYNKSDFKRSLQLVQFQPQHKQKLSLIGYQQINDLLFINHQGKEQTPGTKMRLVKKTNSIKLLYNIQTSGNNFIFHDLISNPINSGGMLAYITQDGQVYFIGIHIGTLGDVGCGIHFTKGFIKKIKQFTQYYKEKQIKIKTSENNNFNIGRNQKQQEPMIPSNNQSKTQDKRNKHQQLQDQEQQENKINRSQSKIKSSRQIKSRQFFYPQNFQPELSYYKDLELFIFKKLNDQQINTFFSQFSFLSLNKKQFSICLTLFLKDSIKSKAKIAKEQTEILTKQTLVYFGISQITKPEPKVITNEPKDTTNGRGLLNSFQVILNLSKKKISYKGEKDKDNKDNKIQLLNIYYQSENINRFDIKLDFTQSKKKYLSDSTYKISFGDPAKNIQLPQWFGANNKLQSFIHFVSAQEVGVKFNYQNIEDSQKKIDISLISQQLYTLQKQRFSLQKSTILTGGRLEDIAFFKQSFPKMERFKLLFRASDYDFEASQFHKICDGFPNTLTIIKTEFGKVIGAYTPLQWKSLQQGEYFPDQKFQSFVMFFGQEINKVKLNKESKHAILCNKSYGPCFGIKDIFISDRCNLNNNSCFMPNSYNIGGFIQANQTTYSLISGSTNGNNCKIAEYQVFQVVNIKE